MKKSKHKIPTSLMQTRINQRVQEQLSKIKDDNHSEFRRGYETASKDVEGLYKPKVEEQKQQLLDQGNNYEKQLKELKEAMRDSSEILPYVENVVRSGWIVQNWRKGWLWLSNWIFILIGWIAYNGIPPELLVFIPEVSRANVIPVLSALGVICRFIDQNRNKPLPLVTAGESDDNRT